jgi:hypothetical protein
LVCAAQLAYYTDARPFTCLLCGREFQSEVSCEQGHFICDSCHSTSANELIEKVCAQSESTQPVELAITLMKSPAVKMHGPEHHYLVPAVLLTTYYNKKGQPDEKAKKLRVAYQRAENVLGGFCGFYGACGAGVGTGIFISLITDSTPLSTETWGLANQITSESLARIAELGGPRCCKRDPFLALKSASEFVREHFSVTLPISDPLLCDFSLIVGSIRKGMKKNDIP